MKKLFLMISIISIIFLGACSNERNVDLSGYDMTDLNNCMIALLDQDDQTVCSVEDRTAYVREYGEYFLDRLNDDLVYVHPALYADSVSEPYNAVISITYSDVKRDEELGYETYQEIFEEMTKDLRELTDVFSSLYLRFAYEDYLGITFVGTNNNPETDDVMTRDFSMSTQDHLVEEMFGYAFDDYLSLLEDETYFGTNFTILATDYNIIIEISPSENKYHLMITEKQDTHYMTEEEIEDVVANLLSSYDRIE